MAMKHRIPLVLATLGLGLTSCGGASYYGTYSFQLGATKGTHMGLYMKLTNEKETNPSTGEVRGEKFTLTMDMNGITSTSSEQDSSEEGSSESSEANSTPKAAVVPSSENGDTNFVLSGYYTIGCEDDANRLNLGTTMFDDFFDTGSGFTVPSELVELILYATIAKSSVTVHIPVSINDLAYQLYWYGYRIDTENWTFDVLSESHKIGTHPTAEDVAAIVKAEKAKGETDNPYEDYRDYHTLSMGLLKQ